MFELFTKIFNKAVDKYASLRQASRKEKRLKSKPWVNSGLLKSIKTKKHLFSKFVKTYSILNLITY